MRVQQALKDPVCAGDGDLRCRRAFLERMMRSDGQDSKTAGTGSRASQEMTSMVQACFSTQDLTLRRSDAHDQTE
jgi:hypothetical protein